MEDLVSGHSVLQKVFCPAPLHIDLVLQTARQLAVIYDTSCIPFARVENLEMPSPLGMSQDVTIQLVCMPGDQTNLRCNFVFLAKKRSSSQDDNSLVENRHAVGLIEIISAHDTGVVAEFERTRKLLKHMQQQQDLSAGHGGEAVQGALV